MKYENIKLCISLSLIFIAFFLGYLFSQRQISLEEAKNNPPLYIDIARNKNSIVIKNTPENIYVRVDGEIIQSGEVTLKE